MRIAAPRCGTAGEIADLVAACFPAENLPPETVESVIFADPDFDPALFLALEGGGRPVGFAVAVVRDGIGFLKLLGVLAGARRRGAGARLLGEIERALGFRGARRVFYDGAAPAYFRPGLAAGNRGGRAFLERHGYRVTGERQSLVVDLRGVDLGTSAAEARLRGGGITFRRAAPEDREFLECQIGALFPGPWAIEARRAAGVRPPALHLALGGGRLAGFAARGGCGPDVFGPMGTAEGHRGRGIGEVLLKRSLADIRDAGFDRALIGWIGPAEYYRRRVPVERAITYLVMEKELR